MADSPTSIPHRDRPTDGAPPRVIPPGPVSRTPLDRRLKGTGLTLDASGRGVKNGRPYGSQLKTETEQVETTYMFRPGAANALRAATRKALGR